MLNSYYKSLRQLDTVDRHLTFQHSLKKNLDDAKNKAHDLLTHVVLLQLVSLITVVWPPQISLPGPHLVTSGEPGGHNSHLFVPDGTHAEIAHPHGFTNSPTLPGILFKARFNTGPNPINVS